MAYYPISDFPETRNYDGDLGWLIKIYKKLLAEYKDLVNIVNELEDLYKDIPDRIKDAIDEALKMILSQMNALADKVNGLEETVEDYTEYFFSLYAYINKVNIALRQYVRYQCDYNLEMMKTLLADALKGFPMLTCPVDGHTENIQDILFHMYNYFGWGIKVEQFDAYEIPVEDFDEMNIPVQDFDKWGFWIFYPRKFNYMFSPFTGKYVPTQVVIMELAGLHMKGVDVEAFDAKNIAVEVFDAANIDVYDFDWTNTWFQNI